MARASAREWLFDGRGAFASGCRRTAGAGAQKGDARSVSELALHRTHASAQGWFWAAPFALGWPRPKLAGIHCFRLVGNLFPLSVDRPRAGRARARGSGTLGTVAVELWSVVDRIAYQKLPKCALGVWWGGIGLFLYGSVLVPTVHPARKPEPGVKTRVSSQNKAGLRLRRARVSFVAVTLARSALQRIL